MRQWNDNQITLARDYKLVWNLENLFPNREGQTEKGRAYFSSMDAYGCLISQIEMYRDSPLRKTEQDFRVTFKQPESILPTYYEQFL